MVLLGVLPLEAETRRRCLSERTAHARRPADGSVALALEALEQREQPLVRDVARRGDDDVHAVVHRAVVRGDRAPADRRDDLRRPDHRASKSVLTEDRLGEEVVHELLRRVLVHRDLLEHDFTLLVEIRERRREDHVAHDVEGRLDVRVRNPRVHNGVLAGGGGVQLGTHGVERLGDLLSRVRPRAFEQEVLDEVRDARPFIPLVARAGADPEAERDGADARDALRDHALAGVELGQRVLLHLAIVPGRGRFSFRGGG